VVIGYVGALTLLGVILARGEMSVGAAYAIWAASGIALTAILGRLLFNDVITRKMYIGIILIILGVIAVELGGH
jgi:small multidrug resistance pump